MHIAVIYRHIAVAAVQIPAVCLPCDVEIHPVCGVAVAVVIIVWRQRHLDIVKDVLHRRLVAEAADRHAAVRRYRHAAALHRVAADDGTLGQAVYLEGEAVFGWPLWLGSVDLIFRFDEVPEGAFSRIFLRACPFGYVYPGSGNVGKSRAGTVEIDFDAELGAGGAFRLAALHASHLVL